MNVNQLEQMMLTMIQRLEEGEYGAADFNAAIKTWTDFAPLIAGGASISDGVTEETVEIYNKLHKTIKEEAEEKSKDRSIPASLLNHIRTFWKMENLNEVIVTNVDVSDLTDGILDSLREDINIGVPLDGIKH